MTIQLPSLPESLDAITAAVSLGDSRSLLILLAVLASIVMLAILAIRYLGRSRVDDKSGTRVEPPNETEPDQLARFIRNSIEQLNGIAEALRPPPPPMAQQVPGQGGPGTTELPRDFAIETMRSVTDGKALALQLAANMHRLTKLTQHMQEERRALERNSLNPQVASHHSAPCRYYLSFTLGAELFATSTLNIHEIVEATQLIAEPSVPLKLRKAIRLRGALVPVIDLGARFGWHNIALKRSSRIVILEVPRADHLQLIGVVVDTVGKVLEIDPTKIEPASPSDSRIRNDFTLGTVRADNRTFTLLDIGRQLLAHELAVPAPAPPAAEQEHAPS